MDELTKEINRKILNEVFFIGYITNYLISQGIKLEMKMEGIVERVVKTSKKYYSVKFEKKELSKTQIKILDKLKKYGIVWDINDESIIITYLYDDLKNLKRKLKLLTILEDVYS